MDNIDKTYLLKLVSLQKKAFSLDQYPDYALRKDKLKRLYSVLLKHEQALIDAVSDDFGHRSANETWLSEIFQVTSTIKYALKSLRSWMAKEKRHTSIIFKPAKNYVYYQPVGVVGIMVPWNYPILLSLSPLIYALAAGNRVCIKLSEHTPKTNRVMMEICKRAFNIDEVAVVTGDATVAQSFSELPFDHLFFTGSTAIGRKVMQAATKNLTPVTLELGGKSPLIISQNFPLKKAAKMITFAKGLNAGQTCIAPDYIFVHAQKLEAFVTEMEVAFKEMYPQYMTNDDYSSVMNEAQFNRLQGYIDEAKDQGVKVVVLDELKATNDHSRKMPISLLLNPKSDLQVMQDEVFGPLLPVLSYQSIEEVISYINQKPRPLAAYLLSYDRTEQEYINRNIISGGMCINDVLNHIAQHDLPFGGVGNSGMGRYHGFEGFKTFSNAKAICQRGRFNSALWLYPPYGQRFSWFRKFLKG
ncbi:MULTISPECIES: coniferyl aldehyde dehydrogenase [Cysteiniphilum]|uniref:Aldehyde dehydrogenase n=1 Tax=Cysteiniphilum litorale TaxID=2056700 RepID=A0A8J3E783_9GAMM|nr:MULTISPECIES: coniferyl aldehyde dehydrogenase [Cysteiniphilum]GGF86775.1 putative coniferyl aldehyde dehydrogenase [Cysteiniphilum litorale]